MKIILAKNTLWYGFFDDLLVWAEQTDFSHVAIEIDGYIYESVFPKSKKIKKSEWLKKYAVIREYSYNIPEEMVQYYKSYIEQQLLGKPYSKLQILAIGLGMLSFAFDKFISKKSLNNHSYLICTELVGRVLMRMYQIMIEDIDTLGLKETEGYIKLLKETYGDIRKY